MSAVAFAYQRTSHAQLWPCLVAYCPVCFLLCCAFLCCAVLRRSPNGGLVQGPVPKGLPVGHDAPTGECACVYVCVRALGCVHVPYTHTHMWVGVRGRVDVHVFSVYPACCVHVSPPADPFVLHCGLCRALTHNYTRTPTRLCCAVLLRACACAVQAVETTRGGTLDAALSHLGCLGAGATRRDFLAALARGLGGNMTPQVRADFENDLARWVGGWAG